MVQSPNKPVGNTRFRASFHGAEWLQLFPWIGGRYVGRYLSKEREAEFPPEAGRASATTEA
jgi:hypothetical protein